MGEKTIRRLLLVTIFLMTLTACSAYTLGTLFLSEEEKSLYGNETASQTSVTELSQEYVSEHSGEFAGEYTGAGTDGSPDTTTEPFDTSTERSDTATDTTGAEASTDLRDVVTTEDGKKNDNTGNGVTRHVDATNDDAKNESTGLSESSDERSGDHSKRVDLSRWIAHTELDEEARAFFNVGHRSIQHLSNYDKLLSVVDSVRRIGIYIEDMETRKVFSFNADSDFYAASTRKLGIATVALDLVAEGKIDPDDYVHYNPEWDDEPGSSVIQVYGKKGNGYPVRTLIEYIGKYSDNIALNMLARKIFASAGRDYYVKRMGEIFKRPFADENYYTPSQLANSVKYLCDAAVRDPGYEVFVNALEECTYNEYATKNMPKGSYFHKNGLYFGEEYNYTNDIGVIYGEHPIVYSIMIEWQGNEYAIPYPLLHEMSKYLRYIATTGDFPEMPMKEEIKEKVYGD